ncbi:hypothetical protein ACQ9LF_11695 [Anaerohalosphaeraceae bacterium U12dextr]
MSMEQSEANKKESLIGRYEVASRLGISYRSFVKLKARLIANGLQEVVVGHSKRYREVSVDRLIANAAEKGTPLGKVKK